jgi:hypothetical protein
MQSPETVDKPASRPIMTWVWQILYILYSIEVGGFLLVLPWLSIWENNYMIYLYPQIRPIIANSFLKGAVLGMGILNLIIGVQEIVESKKHFKKLFAR